MPATSTTTTTTTTTTNTCHNVNILGAGVSGLTTALTLLETSRFKVKVVAKHLPTDLSIEYTSPWAGANWRSFADNDDLQQQKYDAATFKRFAYLAEHEPEAGVMFLNGHDYWDVKPKKFQDLWFSKLLQGYRHLGSDELPDGVQFGVTYRTVTLNAPKYLQYLQKRVLALGGTIEREIVPSLKALAKVPHPHGPVDVIINCSGLGSRSLQGVHDHQMFPTRGQIVIVRVPDAIWLKAKEYTMGRNGEPSTKGPGALTYVIPRENGEIILGGTMDHWDYTEQVCEETTKAIMTRVKATRPDLFADAVVQRSCAGLRPNRRGGVRVTAEVEQLDWNEGWDTAVMVVAHNYGHAGFGYQSSVGCAIQTLQNVDSALAELGAARAGVRTMSKL